MKNKFLVSLLFGTALCAGFGDVAFGAETEAQTQANNLIKKYGVAKFIKDGDFGQQAIQEVALALINDDRVSRGDKEKLQAKLPLASSSIPVRSIPVASTTSDASAGGGSTNSIPPATNPKFSWSTYKNAQKPRWQAEALNEATLSERKFVTSFLKHASRAAILDVLNHIPAERKLALADIIGQTTFEAPTNSIHELSVDEASASHNYTPPASSHRSASLEESFGGGAPARGLPESTTPRKTPPSSAPEESLLKAPAFDRDVAITRIVDIEKKVGRDRVARINELRYADEKIVKKALRAAELIASNADSDTD